MAKVQSANTARLRFEAGGMQMPVLGFTASEGISHLFEADLHLALKEEVKFEDVIGKTALLTIESENHDRNLHGMLSQFEISGTQGQYYLYQAKLVPEAWSLTQQQDCRIFQNKTVQEIVKQILEEGGLTSELFAFRLQGSYSAREYCVQYRESDWDFISRLLEEEGIFYFFEHAQDKHVLVFGDSTVCYQKIAGKDEVQFNPGGRLVAEEEAVFLFRMKRRIQPGKYTHTDYNFEKPDLDLKSEEKSDEHQDLEIYDFPGEFLKEDVGKRLAQIRLQQERMYRDTGHGASVCPRLVPGFTFKLTNHDIQSLNQEYLVYSLNHKGEQPQVLEEQSHTDSGSSYANELACIPSSVTIRPERRTAKPVARGVQSAIVTGPKGEEVYPDKYGRVKVKFHWDRLGKNDENSSCWIRVSQVWAGSGWGGIFIPRIGQEVLVGFIEGDPDRPIVTGRLYHGTNMPPYQLPQEKTKSTLKSDSTIGGNGCNEIRFEDKKGEEELYIQAEKDLNVHVKNDQKSSTERDWHLLAKRDHLVKVERDQHVQVSQDTMVKIGRDKNLDVVGKAAIKVGGSRSLTVDGDVAHKFKNNFFNDVSNAYYLKSMKVVVEAMSELTLKAGGNFIKIDAAGVAINGTLVNINSGGSAGSGSAVNVLSPSAPLAAVAAGPVTAGMMPEDAVAHNAPTHQPTQQQQQRKDWIELELVDEQGLPVTNEKYRVTLPDGTTVAQGTTDENGIARVAGIDPGNCKVTFPNLHKDAWDKG